MRIQYMKEGVDASQLAIKQGTTSNLLKCGKCKKSSASAEKIGFDNNCL